jgi:hypothetical protein
LKKSVKKKKNAGKKKDNPNGKGSGLYLKEKSLKKYF